MLAASQANEGVASLLSLDMTGAFDRVVPVRLIHNVRKRSIAPWFSFDLILHILTLKWAWPMQISYLVTYKEANPLGNKKFPPPACQPVTLAGGCLLLYQDHSPAQLLAGEKCLGG